MFLFSLFNIKFNDIVIIHCSDKVFICLDQIVGPFHLCGCIVFTDIYCFGLSIVWGYLMFESVYCSRLSTVWWCLLLDVVYCLKLFDVWDCQRFQGVYCLRLFIVWSCLLFEVVYCLRLFIVWGCILWRIIRRIKKSWLYSVGTFSKFSWSIGILRHSSHISRLS